MVSWALPGPVGAATAGAARPRIAAVNPPVSTVANPNFFILGALIFFVLLHLFRFAAAAWFNSQDHGFNSIGRICSTVGSNKSVDACARSGRRRSNWLA